MFEISSSVFYIAGFKVMSDDGNIDNKDWWKIVDALPEDEKQRVMKCRDYLIYAPRYGAITLGQDLTTLMQVAGVFPDRNADSVSSVAVSEAFERIEAAIAEAKRVDPERARLVESHRRYEELVEASKDDARKLDYIEENLRPAEDIIRIGRRRERFLEKAAKELQRKDRAAYDALLVTVAPLWEKIPSHLRPKLHVALGAAIGAEYVRAAVWSTRAWEC